MALPSAAGAETFKVTNENDSGPGSLRQALSDTNDTDLVKVPKGHYKLKSPLSVATDIEIRGAGSKKTVIDGRKKTGVFVVTSGTGIQIVKLAITGGKAQFGAAIDSDGDVALDQVLIEGNKAKRKSGRSFGAAIYSNTGAVEITRSTVTRNSSTSGDDLAIGGAIFISGGVGAGLLIDRSVISKNTAEGIGGFGGAIAFTTVNSSGNSALTIIQSTIAGNRALGDGDVALGGSLYYEPTATGAGATTTFTLENSTVANNLARSLQSGAFAGGMSLGAHAVPGASAVENIASSTIAGNEADGATMSQGGGLDLGGIGVPIVANTIVANNKAEAGTEGCSTDVNTADGNLERGTTCGFNNANDISPANPKLGKLGKNGGPTPTMALPKNSPAVDEGISATCPPTDQRGIDRPQGPFCDIGAFELKK